MVEEHRRRIYEKEIHVQLNQLERASDNKSKN